MANTPTVGTPQYYANYNSISVKIPYTGDDDNTVCNGVFGDPAVGDVQTIATTASAAVGATSLSVTALPLTLVTGTVLGFWNDTVGHKCRVVTSLDAAKGATTINVTAIGFAIASGDKSYVTNFQWKKHADSEYHMGFPLWRVLPTSVVQNALAASLTVTNLVQGGPSTTNDWNTMFPQKPTSPNKGSLLPPWDIMVGVPGVNQERMTVTAVAGLTWTVTRNADGLGLYAHARQEQIWQVDQPGAGVAVSRKVLATKAWDLESGTSYDLRMTITDTAFEQVVTQTISTRTDAIPSYATAGSGFGATIYYDPKVAGPGTGTTGDPYSDWNTFITALNTSAASVTTLGLTRGGYGHVSGPAHVWPKLTATAHAVVIKAEDTSTTIPACLPNIVAGAGIPTTPNAVQQPSGFTATLTNPGQTLLYHRYSAPTGSGEGAAVHSKGFYGTAPWTLWSGDATSTIYYLDQKDDTGTTQDITEVWHIAFSPVVNAQYAAAKAAMPHTVAVGPAAGILAQASSTVTVLNLPALCAPAVNEYSGMRLYCLAGQNVNTSQAITSNTATTITTAAFGTTPAVGDRYVVSANNTVAWVRPAPANLPLIRIGKWGYDKQVPAEEPVDLGAVANWAVYAKTALSQQEGCWQDLGNTGATGSDTSASRLFIRLPYGLNPNNMYVWWSTGKRLGSTFAHALTVSGSPGTDPGHQVRGLRLRCFASGFRTEPGANNTVFAENVYDVVGIDSYDHGDTTVADSLSGSPTEIVGVTRQDNVSYETRLWSDDPVNFRGLSWVWIKQKFLKADGSTYPANLLDPAHPSGGNRVGDVGEADHVQFYHNAGRGTVRRTTCFGKFNINPTGGKAEVTADNNYGIDMYECYYDGIVDNVIEPAGPSMNYAGWNIFERNSSNLLEADMYGGPVFVSNYVGWRIANFGVTDIGLPYTDPNAQTGAASGLVKMGTSNCPRTLWVFLNSTMWNDKKHLNEASTYFVKWAVDGLGGSKMMDVPYLMGTLVRYQGQLTAYVDGIWLTDNHNIYGTNTVGPKYDGRAFNATSLTGAFSLDEWRHWNAITDAAGTPVLRGSRTNRVKGSDYAFVGGAAALLDSAFTSTSTGDLHLVVSNQGLIGTGVIFPGGRDTVYPGTGSLRTYHYTGFAPDPGAWVSGGSTAPGNISPTAVAAGTPTSGTVPFNVVFSSAGSTDPDGSIASYFWNFGDGSSSTSANPTHPYITDGTFTAQLTVTDDQGATGIASVAIVASAPAAQTFARSVARTTVARG